MRMALQGLNQRIDTLASPPQTEPRLAWFIALAPHWGTTQGRIVELRVSTAPIPVPMSLKMCRYLHERSIRL